MANPTIVTLHASGAESGADSGAAVDIGASRSAALLSLRATVVGAPLKVTVETSPDGETGWTIAAELELAEAGKAQLAVDELERYVRCTWPAETDATFELTAEAHQIYAERVDLHDALSPEMLERADRKRPGAVARALLNASSRVASALAPIFPMPLTTIPLVVKDNSAALAALQVLVQNGLAGGGIDALVQQRAEAARLWLKAVADRKESIDGIEPAPADAVKGSSGNPTYPDTYPERFSNNWGDFG